MACKKLSSSFSPSVFSSLKRCVPKKLARLLIACVTITSVFVLFLVKRHPHHHAPFEPPSAQMVVHGKIIHHVAEAQHQLKPFPESPRETPPDDDEAGRPPNPWLAAVICAASDAQHRMMIRSTWMRLYGSLPFDGRFVVANPGPRWTEMVAMENRTFGDMIVLDRIPEDDITANTIKTLEFYKWLTESGRRYEFVTKLDTDLWLNARGFWDRFLVPRLSSANGTGPLESTVERTVIGELHFDRTWDLVFPQGSMYTVTWDMVELLSSLQEKHGVETGEDMAVAVLMLKGRQTANFVNFRGTEKFNYNDGDSRGDGTAWARKKTHQLATDHAIYSSDAIAVHRLKTTDSWFKVAACFDENGVRKPPLPSGPDKTPLYIRLFDILHSTGLHRRWNTRFDRIPNFLWSLKEGEWMCDDIWNLGRSKTGYSGE